jgi:hypothetical protein
MNTARIVVPTLALGVGAVAAPLAGASANAVEHIPQDQASRLSESVNGVHDGVAILTTAQK